MSFNNNLCIPKEITDSNNILSEYDIKCSKLKRDNINTEHDKYVNNNERYNTHLDGRQNDLNELIQYQQSIYIIGMLSSVSLLILSLILVSKNK